MDGHSGKAFGVKDMQVYDILAERRSKHLVHRINRAAARSIYCFAMLSYPCAEFMDTHVNLIGKLSISVGRNIPQNIAIPADYIYKHSNQPVKGLNRILRHPSPAGAGAQAQIFLPWYRNELSSDLMRAFVAVKVPLPAGSRVDNHLRRMCAHHGVQLIRFPEPARRGIATLMSEPAAVIPQNIRRSISCNQLLFLCVALFFHELGIVFQDFQLLTDRTVNDNLEFVLRATGWKNKQEIRERIAEVLNLVGMENKGYKLPNELSGGEQQRIVIARAVLNSPEIILADEPTGNLDVETGKAIVELLHNICQAGSLVVMTTHNLQLVTEYPGQVYRCAEHRIVNVTVEFVKRENN